MIRTKWGSSPGMVLLAITGGMLAGLLWTRGLVGCPGGRVSERSVVARDAGLALVAPSAPDLETIVAMADVIVLGNLDAVVNQDAFGGYDESGDLIPVPTPTAGAAATSAPVPAVPITDFSIDAEEVIKDDGTYNPLVLRMTVSGPESTSGQWCDGECIADFPPGSLDESYLFFLTLNPDETTYGLYHGPHDRIIVDGETVTYSDCARTGVSYASGMSGEEFLDAVRDEVESQE